MRRSLECTIIWAIELGGYVQDETATSPSTVVVSGTMTGIRLLFVMVLLRVLRAVKMSRLLWLLCDLGLY
jgi:hypothetical protein